MKKDTQIYLVLVIAVIVVIALIILIKSSGNVGVDEETAKCIADNSIIYASSTCSACKQQKSIFGDTYSLLNEINCLEELQKCRDAGITGTPTWIIDGKKFSGVKTLKELKQLTGC